MSCGGNGEFLLTDVQTAAQRTCVIAPQRHGAQVVPSELPTVLDTWIFPALQSAQYVVRTSWRFQVQLMQAIRVGRKLLSASHPPEGSARRQQASIAPKRPQQAVDRDHAKVSSIQLSGLCFL